MRSLTIELVGGHKTMGAIIWIRHYIVRFSFEHFFFPKLRPSGTVALRLDYVQ